MYPIGWRLCLTHRYAPYHSSVVLDLPRQHLVLRHQGAVQVKVGPRRQRHQQQEEYHDRGDLSQRRVDALRMGGDFWMLMKQI